MLNRDLNQAAILIVDDEKANIRLLEIILTEAGYTNVHSTCDARDTLALYREIQPDLLLLDLSMPHQDGFAVMRQLGAEMPPPLAPILVLTADATPDARHRALGEGAQDFLTKPLDRPEVLLRIRNLLTIRFHNVLLETKVRERTRESETARLQLHHVVEQANCVLWQAVVQEATGTDGEPLDPLRKTVGAWELKMISEGQARAWLSFGTTGGETIADAWKRTWYAPNRALVYGTAHEAMRLGQERYALFLRSESAQSAVRWVREEVRIEPLLPSEERGPTGHRLRRWQLTGVVADMTEQKLLEERQRETAEQLIRSNAALQEFFHIASHDLKEPLRKVQSLGNLLIRKVGPTLPDESRDYIDRMGNAAGRMQGLLEALLEYSLVLSKVGEPDVLDLNEVAAEAATHLERVRPTPIRIEIGALPAIRADRAGMRQLFDHLIGNAIKFRRPDTDAFVRITGTCDTGGISLTIEDNGIGFAPEHADRIFRLFERLEDRGNAVSRGIGLTLCKKIVERQGGTIVAEGRPGEGATFRIRLPYH